jgi:hypothetical protein
MARAGDPLRRISGASSALPEGLTLRYGFTASTSGQDEAVHGTEPASKELAVVR